MTPTEKSLVLSARFDYMRSQKQKEIVLYLIERIHPFCKFTTGRGKSTLLRIAAKFYFDTFLLSDGISYYSHDHLLKFLFFCYDVDDKMDISLTRWNMMVYGDSIAVQDIQKEYTTKIWTDSAQNE
jgi:hypothetical protein